MPGTNIVTREVDLSDKQAREKAAERVRDLLQGMEQANGVDVDAFHKAVEGALHTCVVLLAAMMMPIEQAQRPVIYENLLTAITTTVRYMVEGEEAEGEKETRN